MATLTINGASRELEIHPAATLLTALRDQLRLTGAKRGCNQGVCGACTVLVDGWPVRACLSLALNCEGSAITTIEGLGNPQRLAPIQHALAASGAVQCGFCTSGIALVAHAFLQRNPHPTGDDVRAALAGNLCRCSGYQKIIDAVLLAAREAAP
ncbi:MAG: (2Fe-2S)-binding protein [Gammaproteobacteria bacterium]